MKMSSLSGKPDIFRCNFQRDFAEKLDLLSIVPHLKASGLLIDQEVEALLNNHITESERILKLTSFLSSKGPQCVPLFLECLRRESTHLGHAELRQKIEDYLAVAAQCSQGSKVVRHPPEQLNDSSSIEDDKDGSRQQRSTFKVSQAACISDHTYIHPSTCSTNTDEQGKHQRCSDGPVPPKKKGCSALLTQHQMHILELINLHSLIPCLNLHGLLIREEEQQLTNPLYTEHQRIQRLINFIERKGENGYCGFLAAINEEKSHIGHRELHKILTQEHHGSLIEPGQKVPYKLSIKHLPETHQRATPGIPITQSQFLCDQCSVPTATHPTTEYANYLKAYYTSQALPNYAPKWGPRSSKKYINLALINKAEVNRTEANTFTKQTIHGNINDIMKVKTPVTLSEVAAPMPDGSQPRCIVVEGAPGVGKTTFAWEICRRWGSDDMLKRYDAVVLLRLREKRVQNIKYIQDLFFHTDRKIKKAVAKQMQARNGEGLLIILEGYDEWPERKNDTEDSLLIQLIEGCVFPYATVLVTTRSSARECLLKHCEQRMDQHIEILGFIAENIDAYVDSVLGEDQDLVSDFREYLQCYPHIYSAMYVPLHCAIVVEVYKTSRTSKSGEYVIPKTMTELYYSLTRTLLLRYLQQHPVHGKQRWRLHSFSDLPNDVFQQLRRLSKLAYDGLIRDQVIFTETELPYGTETLGLMQCVQELYIDEGVGTSYNFVHLTLQEYLAAYHISQQPRKVQIKEFKNYRADDTKRRIMLRFLAGITKFKGIREHSLKYLFFHTSEPELNCHISVDGLHWLFEAQCNEVISLVLGSLVTLDATWTTVNPFDCFVLGYCIAHSNSSWVLDLTECDIGDEGLAVLSKGVMEGTKYQVNTNIGSISCIYARGNGITTAGIRHLLQLPAHILSGIKELELGNNRIDKAACDLLAQYTPMMTRLETISLSGNPIGSGGGVHLLKSICHHQKHSLLSLFSTGVGQEECEIVAKLLESGTSLHTLYIGGNKLTSESAEMIITKLHTNSSLQHLFIGGAAFSSHSTSLLASALKQNQTLIELDIRYCGIDSEGAHVLADALTENSTLKDLIMDGNPIEDSGANSLAEMLKRNTSLQSLWINETVGKRGLYKIIESLQHNSTLKELILNLSDTYEVHTIRHELEKGVQNRIKLMNDA